MDGKRIEEAAKTWKYIILGSLFYLALIALFASESYVGAMLNRERQLNYGVLGQGPAGHAEARASNWYESTFMSSGVVTSSLKFFAAGESQSSDGRLERTARPVLGYLESRVRTMWLLLYQLLVRISVAAMWWPYVIIIFTPVIVDAITQRRIASTNFSTPSPTMHVMAKSLVWMFLLGAVSLIFAPIPLNPVLTPALIILGASAMWLSMTMFAKSA